MIEPSNLILAKILKAFFIFIFFSLQCGSNLVWLCRTNLSEGSGTKKKLSATLKLLKLSNMYVQLPNLCTVHVWNLDVWNLTFYLYFRHFCLYFRHFNSDFRNFCSDFRHISENLTVWKLNCYRVSEIHTTVKRQNPDVRKPGNQISDTLDHFAILGSYIFFLPKMVLASACQKPDGIKLSDYQIVWKPD